MKFSIVLNMDRFSEDLSMREVWRRVDEMAGLADEGGFDMIFTAEHHTIEATIAPNPFQVLAAWSRTVKRARLGTGVLSASYWHPIRLAGEAALCDIITDGRLEIGIGRGSYQYEFDRMKDGMPQQEGVAYMKEIIPVVRELWKGDYAHDGKYFQFPAATSVPKPLQREVPMWCAARDPASFDWAVKNGLSIMATPLHAPFSEVENLVSRFENTLENNPGIKRPKLMMLRRTAVYEDAKDWQVPVESLTNYGRYFENLLKNLGKVKNGFCEPVGYETVSNRSDYAPESLRENMMFGTPDEVVKKLKAYEALGIDYFMYGAFFGMPYDRVKRSIELFCKDVLPHFNEAR
ncbi:LLM class flavin-dependent oxidoreductase [Paraburkholderia sp. Ac-20336]|uniref:LLM class flavin-dependent oxidoreductase n=1 Tax=Paraburkholderia sp. Ac-20336 TaxID=2703886 RepID=UPI00197FCFB2|nr:LLM class flavin-dependent oxidoreductase [Paraburkholderia sp. Ac-20336]